MDSPEDGENKESFLLTDDYMRSFHPEIISAAVVSAILRTESTGEKIVSIEYEVSYLGISLYYRGTMKVDLLSFIFEEREFRQIKA